MIRTLLLVIAIFGSISSFSQKIPLIKSGEVIDQGIAAYDSGNYADAIKSFLAISPRDTNYVLMLAELALAYNGAQEYEKTIETCDEGLKLQSPYKAMFLKSKAIALDKKGEYAQSVELFVKAMAMYPTDQNLVFNLGVTHFNNNQFEKAKDCFFRSLSINPYHGASHINLGNISIKEGRKTHALLSYGMYLAVNNEDNGRLVMLNSFLANEEEDEGSLTPAGLNAFEKLDQVIRARLALEKSFKTKVPIDAAVVKQFELFFQQLDMYDKDVDDPWVKFYIPIYSAFRDKNSIETYLYHILSSAANETVKKWHKKNDKLLNGFYDLANTEIKKRRTNPLISSESGIDPTLPGWYNDDGNLIAFGRENADGKNIGPWTYFYTNGERSAVGTFGKDGIKTGIWKYYGKKGNLISEENQETGEIISYYPTGDKSQRYFVKNGKTDGLVEIWHPCGNLKEKLFYKDGQIHGRGEMFFSNGQKSAEYNYDNGKLTGEYKTWHEDGKPRTLYINKDGKANGPYTEKFSNGRVVKTGAYLDDELDGVWKYYYSNGQMSRTGSYKKNLGEGEWIFYDQRGEVTERRNLLAGELHGDNMFYENGNLHFVNTYEKGKLTRVAFYDEEGKIIKEFGDPKGNFSLKGYFFTGELKSEGQVKDGYLSGKWKYYHRGGQLASEYTYEKGKTEGQVVSYFPTGAVKIKSNYVNNELHGYYQEFYEHGPVKYEGWYQNGKRQQQFLSYNANGKTESDYYYLDDKMTGTTYDYFDGKVTAAITYEDDRIDAMENYNAKGEMVLRGKKDGPKITYEIAPTNTPVIARFSTECGEYNGEIARWFSDGNPFFAYPIVAGRRHGKYLYYAPLKQLQLEGQYVDGYAEGLWKGYDSHGKVDYTGWYLNDNYDSAWTYFYPNGKVSSTVTYLQNERDGITSMFAPDGTPAIDKRYEMGDLIAYRAMTKEGKWSEWTRTSGDALIQAYYPNGKLSAKENHMSSRLIGKKIIYYPDGNVYSEFNYVNGENHGPFAVYYPDGKPEIQGNYQFDDYDGVVRIFNPDGTLLRTEEYTDGSRSGKMVLYNKGVKSKELNFWGGLPHE